MTQHLAQVCDSGRNTVRTGQDVENSSGTHGCRDFDTATQPQRRCIATCNTCDTCACGSCSHPRQRDPGPPAEHQSAQCQGRAGGASCTASTNTARATYLGGTEVDVQLLQVDDVLEHGAANVITTQYTHNKHDVSPTPYRGHDMHGTPMEQMHRQQMLMQQTPMQWTPAPQPRGQLLSAQHASGHATPCVRIAYPKIGRVLFKTSYISQVKNYLVLIHMVLEYHIIHNKNLRLNLRHGSFLKEPDRMTSQGAISIKRHFPYFCSSVSVSVLL